jgi:hypothetical protein
MVHTGFMNTLYQVPRLHEHEGFYYVELNGEFFKGCRRCGGTGHYSFNGSDSICYLCDNDTDRKLGDHFSTEADAKKWCHGKAVAQANRNRKRESERLAKLAKRDEAWDALEASHPAVWKLLTRVVNVRDWNKPDGDIHPSTSERNPFVLKMAEQLWHLDEWSYSEKMLTALQNIASKRTEESLEAESHPAPTGRVVVTGEVTSAKVVENDFGTAYKILVKDDAGFKVWCSLPKAQADEAHDTFLEEVQANGHSIYDFGSAVWLLGTEGDHYNGIKGRRITFTATLEASKDDVAFAFGSRPTKGAWL